MRLRRFLPDLLIYGFYLAVAVAVTWPLAGNLSTHLAGFAYGDSTEMARHIWWYNHALRTGQSIFWQPTLGYPDGMAGVILWAHPQQFFPAWLFAFFMTIPAAANLSILLYMALNGWAMQVLARHLLSGRRAPALLAGLVFMAAPTFQGHLGGGHAGLMVMWPVPLYILALLHLRRTATIRWLALATLFFALSPGGHILQLIYVLLPITAVFVLAQIWQREWAWLMRTILATIAGCAILLIFILPVAGATFNTPAYTQEGGFVRYSVDLLAAVSPSFFNPLYANLDYARQVLGVNLEEGSSYIGIIAGALALVALFRRPPESSPTGPRWWLALALVAWMLALGPLLKIFDAPIRITPDGYDSYVTLPWAAVQNLPLFSLARTPGRFNFTLALAVAMLAGYGAARLGDRLSARGWLRSALFGVLMLAILLDYQWYWPFPTMPATIPAAIQALRERDDVRAVFDIPWGNPVATKAGLYLQTAHQQPLVAGHVTRSTPVNPAKLSLLEQTLDPALLNQAGADVVIVHKVYADADQLTLALANLGAPVYEDDNIAVFETADTRESPDFAALTAANTVIEHNIDSWLYAPGAGWVDFSGTLTGAGRSVDLYFDTQLVRRWHMDGQQSFSLSLPVAAYHTVTLALNPSCPANDDPALYCPGAQVKDLKLGDFTPADRQEIAFDRGVTLLNGVAEERAEAGKTLAVRLLWAFDGARDEDDIRFVHVIDADGNLIAQDDQTLGDHRAATQWAETVRLQLPDDLPAGDYRVYIGWYTYPDFSRFGVLSAVEGAQDGLALLGTVAVE